MSNFSFSAHPSDARGIVQEGGNRGTSMESLSAVLALIAVGIPPAPSAQAARGEIVYFGEFFPLNTLAAEPIFIDERIVEERDGVLVSTHLTRDRGGAIVI